jgi:hypothetical protein
VLQHEATAAKVAQLAILRAAYAIFGKNSISDAQPDGNTSLSAAQVARTGQKAPYFQTASCFQQARLEATPGIEPG